MILLLIILFLFLCYSILIIYYWQSWRTIPEYIPAPRPATIKISVLIPARNEEENIERLLQALQQQIFPAGSFEVMVIDDHSTDATAAIVARFPAVKLLQLKTGAINSYKKKAI